MPRTVKFVETESRMVVAKGWEQTESRHYCLMGTEPQSCEIQSSGGGRRWWSHNSEKVLNATDLHTLKWLDFCYVYFTTISKEETQDVFLFPSLNFDVNHNSAWLSVGTIRASDPAKAWAGPGHSLEKGAGSESVADRERLDLGRSEAKQTLMGRKGLGQGRTWGSLKEPRSKPLIVSKVSGPESRCRARGRSHKQAGTQVLEGQVRSR